MRNKTIWIFNQTSGTPNSGWGERHFYLSKIWKEKGYDTYIFSGSYNHLFRNQPSIGGKKLSIEKVEEGVTFCWVKTPKYKVTGFSKFMSNLIFTIRLFFLNLKEIPRPNVILVSSMPIFPIVVGNIFKKRYNSQKLIIEIRDLWPLTPIHLKGYSKRNPLVLFVAWFERYAYRVSDHIVSVLPNAYKYIDKISGQPDKFNYIPNGIDINPDNFQSLPVEIENLIPKNKFIIGYAGTIGFANAMDYFIEASKILIHNDKIHFVLVGDGVLVDQYKSSLLESQQNVTFIPKIPKDQIGDMISNFDVCYLGRFNSELYQYGVSYNKYFDYMYARKPILESSDYINDQVEQSGCGLIVPPENSEAIVKGIEQLFEMSENERDEMGKKGFDFVMKYHTYQYLSNLYINLFE